MKLCCIIIMNFNEKEYLKNCLDSIKRNTNYSNYKIIVLDNNSNDGSKRLIKVKYLWVDLIENLRNEGASKTLNIGIKYALEKYDPDYFYLLNNDTLVEKNWLTDAIKTISKDKKIGIVGSKQLTFEEKPSISAGWISMWGVNYYRGNSNKEVNWVSGAGLLIKKEVIEKIGLLDEIYSPAYYEETDFEKRAINAGFKILYNPKSVIYHKGSGTIRKLDQDKIFYIFYKNRTRFFLKHFSIYYFLPRIFLDIYKSIKLKKFKILIKAYKEGYKSLK